MTRCPSNLAMRLCHDGSQTSAAEYTTLRKIVDASLQSEWDVHRYTSVYTWLADNYIIGKQLYDIYQVHCGADLGVFCRTLDLVYELSLLPMSVVVSRFNNPRVAVMECVKSAKTPFKKPTLDELVSEIERLA